MASAALTARLLLTAVCLLAAVSVVEAQVDKPELGRHINNEDKSVLGSIRGRVLLPNGNYVSVNIKVTLQTLRDTVATIYTDGQGQFEFPDLIPGNYQIEVDPTDREHFDVSNEPVQVFKGMPSVVMLTLKPHEPPKTPNRTGAVSVSELERNVPAKARKEFDKAAKASEKGLVDQAIIHLRNAIEIYPDFVRAHNDLGVQLLSLGRLDEASEVLRRAVSLDEKAFNPALNLGIVLVHLHRFSEANEILSRALNMQPNAAAARLYSGLALKGLGDLDGAERDFKGAYENGGVGYSVALFHLGEIYLSKGNRSLALEFFQRYLAEVPNAANADQVRKMIAMLR